MSSLSPSLSDILLPMASPDQMKTQVKAQPKLNQSASNLHHISVASTQKVDLQRSKVTMIWLELSPVIPQTKFFQISTVVFFIASFTVGITTKTKKPKINGSPFFKSNFINIDQFSRTELILWHFN